MTAEDLEARWRSADPEAFEILFRRHGPALLGYIQTLVSDRALAEDITQQTFLQLWRSVHRDSRRPDRVARFSTLAHLIARRLAWNALRRKRPAPMNHSLDSVIDEHADPHRLAEDRERRQMVMELVHQLPEEEREVLWLQAREGQSYREVARILELSVDQVRSRLAAGYRKVLAGLRKREGL